MSDYCVSQIYKSDKRSNRLADSLLLAEGIRRDSNLDYTCGIFDEDMNIIATGSCFKNTLRCLAVSSIHQGEGLMNLIITHLTEVQFMRGNLHLFLYTKCSSAKFFGDLGFYEIARVDGQVVFMENQRNGFSNYLDGLKIQDLKGHLKIAALVMNANPFTLGHQYLAETASKENDLVHLFLVSEDASLVPYSVRKRLTAEGISHLPNITLHDSGPYIISSSTFPSYFQKDESAVIESHAYLDLTVFIKIAQALGITRRYVGEEPLSLVTGIYNQIMGRQLPNSGIQCIVTPRRTIGSEVISASTVRKAIQNNDMEKVKSLVPETTYHYFSSTEAEPVIAKISSSDNVIHY